LEQMLQKDGLTSDFQPSVASSGGSAVQYK
jgi:hypothetical protein